ncbi:uncharacterized protein LOC131245357 isoform X2 [Magnolia sinica]|uniref:uncharacterized protein LOC131245357 isoform X2 n=1 Tax=Magnolia sinica TaxID=86752 RepID=UPI002658C679|nr:uncharacterized protein LOC131245357 isoform X2 [Magnolia sinica]
MACRGLSSPFHAYAYSNNKKHHRHSLPKQIQSPINRNLLSLQSSPGIPSAVVITRAAASTAMDSDERRAETISENPPMKLLFVEMGVGYDQHGQDITAAAMRACKDAISSNSIPAFRSGAIPGVNTDQMKLQIKLGVPRSTQQFLDIEKVKSVFPYGLLYHCMVWTSAVCKFPLCVLQNSCAVKL